MKKYELTRETKVIDGVELHRIKALKSFGNIKKGEFGGWIESKKNLSQDGGSWVYDNATVRGNAKVCDNAMVFRNATISENAVVGGNAIVGGNATISGDAMVGGNATVFENATISGDATVGGYAMVCDNAVVCGHATVDRNAWVGGDAKVGGNADYIVFKNWWSSGRYFTWTRSNNKWKVGCFYGSGEELIAKAYKDSEKSGREYERVVNYVESIFERRK